MPLDPSLIIFVEELFAPLGLVRVRKMFSGGGIYCDGVMFGLISRNTIYLKVDQSTIPAFKAEGSAPFVYKSRSKLVEMSYWRLPDRLLDDTDEAIDWAKRALEIVRKNHKKEHSQKLLKRSEHKK